MCKYHSRNSRHDVWIAPQFIQVVVVVVVVVVVAAVVAAAAAVVVVVVVIVVIVRYTLRNANYRHIE